MIRAVASEDIPACVEVIRKSFLTVAEEYGITEENAPRFTAFATDEGRLWWHKNGEHRPMFVYCRDGVICGYYSLLLQEDGSCELSNLAVLPEYRHLGIGKLLLEHAWLTAESLHCKVVHIGIVEENRVLRKWYEQNGAVHTGTKKYDFFPFTCGYLEKELSGEISLADIDNICLLSKLELSEEEKAIVAGSLREMLEMVGELQKCTGDAAGALPGSDSDLQGATALSEDRGAGRENLFLREDVVVNFDGREAGMSNAPSQRDGMFVVPKTF